MRARGQVFLLLMLFGAPAAAQAVEASAARLTFVKVFKNSQPEYTRVTVQEDGQASYQGGSAEEPDEPEPFQLSASVTARVFELSAALNHFRRVELEFPRQVAHMGRKTFIYEEAGERTQVSYNYTRNAAAQELQALFEGIARGRYLKLKLEFHLQFDRLGMLQALREFERDFNAGGLVDTEQIAPLLKRISSDRRLMRLAQTRARDLLRRIQGTTGRLQFEHADEYTGWYTKVIVEERGTGTYERRGLNQPPQEKPLPLPPNTVARLMELVREANYFRGGGASSGAAGQASGYRLTYEAGPEHHEVAFSAPPDASLAEIVHLVQQALRQEDLRSQLQAALEKESESMMLQVVLQELETAVRSNSLVAPKQFEPLLERIAKSGETHAMVREQAERILAWIRAGG